MTSVPYLYVNILALCCYVVIITAFLAAKKTPENKSFIAVLSALIVWTLGSIFMRLQVLPGIPFWFYVSILGLFATPVLLYLFVCCYTGVRQPRLRAIWLAGSAVVLLCTALGLFIQPPAASILPSGDIYFTYHMGWPILIPYIFFGAVVVSVIRNTVCHFRKTSAAAAGMPAIIAGCIIVAAGNLVQIAPGNVFPFDMLAGIILAGCLTFALVRKKVFRLELLISSQTLQVLSIAICFVITLYFVAPAEQLIRTTLRIDTYYATMLIVSLSIAIYIAAYILLKKLFATLFSGRRRQEKALARFSQRVSVLPDTDGIAKELFLTARQDIQIKDAYIFFRQNGIFKNRFMSGACEYRSLTFSAGSPIVRLLQGTQYLLMDDFRQTDAFSEITLEEQGILESLSIQCVTAIKNDNEIIGLFMTTEKQNARAYSESDIDFLCIISNMAALAVKKSLLYERLLMEARLDNLTGAFNFSYYIEKSNAYFAHNQKELALIFFGIDDMKLYNQLYGVEAGDYVIKHVAQAIMGEVQSRGTVFRHSGKTFAVLLPFYTASLACELAKAIQLKLYKLAWSDAQLKGKTITLSAGICASPDGAKTAHELSDHADIALFNARTSGKGKIRVFSTTVHQSKEIAAHVKHIVETSENKNNSLYAIYSSTILALTAAIDAKDHYTYTHSQNVAYYSSTLAVAAGLNDDQVRLVYEAALLHDIGKISIPEAILGKTGGLTDEERQVMNTHVENALEIIRHLPSMDYVVPAAIGHHERWDGKGYPRGLSGEEIPISARCLAIADVFDAITSDRPYRTRLPLEFAIKELETNRGKQFDPWLVQVFLELIEKGEITVASPQIDAV